MEFPFDVVPDLKHVHILIELALAVKLSGPSVGHIFWGFSKFQIWALKFVIGRNCSNHDFGGFIVLSGSLELQDTRENMRGAYK